MVILTKALIKSCESNGRSHTRATVKALGAPWPPQSGWKERLVGTEISDEDFERARAGARVFTAGTVKRHKRWPRGRPRLKQARATARCGLAYVGWQGWSDERDAVDP